MATTKHTTSKRRVPKAEPESKLYVGKKIQYNGQERMIHSINNDGTVNLRGKFGMITDWKVDLNAAAAPPPEPVEATAKMGVAILRREIAGVLRDMRGEDWTDEAQAYLTDLYKQVTKK